MESIVKIAAIAVAAALCAVTVRKQTPELAAAIALTAGALLLGLTLPALESVTGLMETLRETTGIAPAVLAPVVKTVGISIVTKVTAEICRDAKEGGIAAFAETAGVACALFAALPLVEMVWKVVIGLL